MTDPYTEAEALFPKLGRYRKLIVSLIATVSPFVLWLLEGPHTPVAIVGASFGLLLANFGVYRVPNSSDLEVGVTAPNGDHTTVRARVR